MTRLSGIVIIYLTKTKKKEKTMGKKFYKVKGFKVKKVEQAEKIALAFSKKNNSEVVIFRVENGLGKIFKKVIFFDFF